jgi:predicted nucleic acid-binding protein
VIVLDASAVVELLLGTKAGIAVRQRVSGGNESLHAPHLMDVEVAQVLRRYQATGAIDDTRGREALEDLGDLDVARYPHDPLLLRVWQLRANLTAYDAVYVALAEALGAPLLTRDRRIASVPGHRARVETI